MNSRSSRLLQIVTVVLLLTILGGAGYARLWHLTPPEAGIDYAPDTDEGAYAFSAQLMLQGHWPYRDFFATLPPGGLYLFSAVLGTVLSHLGQPRRVHGVALHVGGIWRGDGAGGLLHWTRVGWTASRLVGGAGSGHGWAS